MKPLAAAVPVMLILAGCATNSSDWAGPDLERIEERYGLQTADPHPCDPTGQGSRNLAAALPDWWLTADSLARRWENSTGLPMTPLSDADRHHGAQEGNMIVSHWRNDAGMVTIFWGLGPRPFFTQDLQENRTERLDGWLGAWSRQNALPGDVVRLPAGDDALPSIEWTWSQQWRTADATFAAGFAALMDKGTYWSLVFDPGIRVTGADLVPARVIHQRAQAAFECAGGSATLAMPEPLDIWPRDQTASVRFFDVADRNRSVDIDVLTGAVIAIHGVPAEAEAEQARSWPVATRPAPPDDCDPHPVGRRNVAVWPTETWRHPDRVVQDWANVTGIAVERLHPGESPGPRAEKDKTTVIEYRFDLGDLDYVWLGDGVPFIYMDIADTDAAEIDGWLHAWGSARGHTVERTEASNEASLARTEARWIQAMGPADASLPWTIAQIGQTPSSRVLSVATFLGVDPSSLLEPQTLLQTADAAVKCHAGTALPNDASLHLGHLDSYPDVEGATLVANVEGRRSDGTSLVVTVDAITGDVVHIL